MGEFHTFEYVHDSSSCLCFQLMFLAYLFFLVWLGVTAFTSLPVFMYFNVWSMCKNTSLVEGANLCLDLRQFGELAVVKVGVAFRWWTNGGALCNSWSSLPPCPTIIYKKLGWITGNLWRILLILSCDL